MSLYKRVFPKWGTIWRDPRVGNVSMSLVDGGNGRQSDDRDGDAMEE
jgi:hypothetical protein